MENNIHEYDEQFEFPIVLQFILENNDSITIGGNSVSHIFFEFSRKFPEKFPFKAIGFSGQTKEESQQYLNEFLHLISRYNQQ